MNMSGEDKTKRLWNLESPTECREFLHHTVAVKPDGSTVRVGFVTNKDGVNVPLDRAADYLVLKAVVHLLDGNFIYH
jgi:hypothetical protein